MRNVSNLFYVNLFNPLENSDILNEKSLNRRTNEILLNETLLTGKQENESK